ncbi:FAD:protein FMN transferase [bacterium]|nr:FAD:protein FMN transferase [bacterium]
MARPLAGALVLGLLTALSGCAGDAPPRRYLFASMGTRASLELRDKGGAGDSLALARVQERFAAVEAAMSVWDAGSELSRANRAAVDSALTLSPLVGNCLTLAHALRAASGGAFEPGAGPLMRLWGFTRRQGRLPAADSLAALLPVLGAYDYDAGSRRLTRRHPAVALDLGGIAKGYALDLAAAELRGLGLASALIDLGGNLYCLGEAGRGEAWQVGIRDPRDRERYFAALALRDEAVATSGSYERFVTIDGRRYGHIMNPATGRPAEGLLSATTVCRSAALGDGLSTALFVLGPAGARRLLAERYPEVLAVLVLPGPGDSLHVQASAALAGRLTIAPADRERCRLEFF